MVKVILKEDSAVRAEGNDLLPVIYNDIILLPANGEVVFVTQPQADELYEKTKLTEKAAKEVMDAKKTGDQENVSQAVKEMNKTLLMVGDELDESTAKQQAESSETALAVTSNQNSLVEVVSYGKNKMMMAPARFFENIKKTDGDLANTFKLIKEDSDSDQFLGDTFKSLRTETGELDKEKVKKAFGQVKSDVSIKWAHTSKKDGNIPSNLLAMAVSPVVAAFLKDDHYKAFDTWVEKFNKNTKASWNKKDDDKKELLKLLKKKEDEFSPDDADMALRMVQDIWGKKHDEDVETDFTKFAEEIRIDKNYTAVVIFKDNNKRKKLIQEIEKQKLPPVCWDASVDAQLLRYSFGVTCEANFDLAKGQLNAKAQAEANLSLAEGKAEINGYIPNDQGGELKFNLTVRKEKYKWREADLIKNETPSQFFFNNSFFIVPAVKGVFHNLSDIDSNKDFYHKKLAGVQIIGHTDEVDTNAYNKRLSEERAKAVHGFLVQDVSAWMHFFDNNTWGDEEIEYMQLVIHYLVMGNRFINMNELQADIMDVSPKERLRQYNDKIKMKHGELFSPMAGLADQEKHMSHFIEGVTALSGKKYPKYDPYNFKKPNKAQLHSLITYYFYMVSDVLKNQLSMATKFDDTVFFLKTPVSGKGEEMPLAGTLGREVRNRRVQLQGYVIDETKTICEEVEEQINLGFMRLMVQGFVSAWVGANLSVAAEINVDCPKGTLLLGEAKKGNGTESEQKNESSKTPSGQASGKVEGFAGAKAEAGLKAMLDWKEPKVKGKSNKNEFVNLGSVGYTITGMAGAGFEGELKIGFDRESSRFQVKISAKAALGLGAGGAFSFSVGVNQLWDFVCLVHNQLKDKDFSFVDMFERGKLEDGTPDESGIDVYKLYSAWMVELLKDGHVLKAGAAFVAGTSLSIAMNLLQDADDIIRKYERKAQETNNLAAMVEQLNKKPEMIERLTPETKGRILYLLTRHKTDWWDDIYNNGTWFDRNHDYEEAALAIIEKGIASKRDWQETLEHMADYSGTEEAKRTPYVSNTKDPKKIPTSAELEEKAKRADANQLWLKNHLLNDKDDWKRVEKVIDKLDKQK